jgi:hypothetical protein
MDDVTKAVLAEVWIAEDKTVRCVGPDGLTDLVLFAEGPGERAHLLTLEQRNEARTEDAARARIASAAPEALRLLLDAEYGVGAVCRWCALPRYADQHMPDCRWLALMKKAGLR